MTEAEHIELERLESARYALTKPERIRERKLLTKWRAEREAEKRIADHVDGYDRDDLGESPDY